jgi:ribosomal protein S8E
MTEAAATDISQHSGSRKWKMPEKSRAQIEEPIPVVKQPADSSSRLQQYREAMAPRAEKSPEVVSHHGLEQNAERLKLRYDLERQLQALTARAEQAMAHHGIEENAERLKLRYHLNPQPEAPALRAEKTPVLSHHGIEQNVERLKMRYHLDRQPEATAASAEKAIAYHRMEQNVERLKLRYDLDRQPENAVVYTEKMSVKAHLEPKINMEKIKSSAGLYRDKVSWAKYMKETFDAVLRERLQPVPVIASSYGEAGIP